VAINQLFGPFFGFFIVGGEDRDAVCYVTVFASEVGGVAAHLFPLIRF